MQIKYNAKTYWLCQRVVQKLKHLGGHSAPRLWSTKAHFLRNREQSIRAHIRHAGSGLGGLSRTTGVILVWKRIRGKNENHSDEEDTVERGPIYTKARQHSFFLHMCRNWKLAHGMELILYPMRSALWSMGLPPISTVFCSNSEAQKRKPLKSNPLGYSLPLMDL